MRIGGVEARPRGRIQALWGGYGELLRVELAGGSTAIVKHVRPPALARGADVGDARKRRSYDVETAWYRLHAPRCDASCRVPALIEARVGHGEWLLVLEDLDRAGFPERRRSPDASALGRCLAWLAALHARFLGAAPEGLWETGTYWHLATRREELATIEDTTLREAAPELDRRLSSATFQTIVHGDAKPANFCFAPGARAVAAVDFQYAGGGCGMRDVAYLLHGERSASGAAEARHLDLYFAALRRALEARGVDATPVETEWRALYPVAVADFGRFMAGWAPAHWRSDRAGQERVRAILRAL